MITAAALRFVQPPKPPTHGHNRAWLKCRTCGRFQFYDYVPYSLSTPVRIAVCDHCGIERGLGCDDVDEATVYAAMGWDGPQGAQQSPVDGAVPSPPSARAETPCAALGDATPVSWAMAPRVAHTPDPTLALAVLVIEWMSPVWRAAPQTPRSAAWWVGRVEAALFDARSPWPDAPTLLRAAALVAERYTVLR